MSYRMANLAKRLACHFGSSGGGGTTTTSPSIPKEFLPYLTPLIQDSAGRMRGLQEYFWGGEGEGQGYNPQPIDEGWGYEGDPTIPGQGGITPEPGYDPRRVPIDPATGLPYVPPDATPPGTTPPGDTIPPVDGGDDVTDPPGDTDPDGPTRPTGRQIPIDPNAPTDPAAPADPAASIDPGDPTAGLPMPPFSMPQEAIEAWWVDQGFLLPDGTPGPNHPNPPAGAADPRTPAENPETPTGTVPPTVMDMSKAGDTQNLAMASYYVPPVTNTADTTANKEANTDIELDEDGLPIIADVGEVLPYDITGIGIHEDNARSVAGASTGQQQAGLMTDEIATPSAGEGAAWGGLGDLMSNYGRMATGQGMAQDAGVNAAFDTFQNFGAPMIQDEYSSMGLGRSDDKGEALGMGLASMMQPATQDYLSRQTGMIDRDVGIADRSIDAGMGLAGQELTRQGTAFDAYSQIGDTQRGIAQEKADAPWEDFMRRSALGETTLMGPFGGIVPSAIGSKVTSSGGGK